MVSGTTCPCMNGLTYQRQLILAKAWSQGDAESGRGVQVHERLERIERIQQGLAVVFDGEVGVVFLREFGQ